ncbi:MAG TPA: hypothetical protein VFM11_02335 [Burkholderiales bacterium]|nr:hypothetical protein [Burkholderiales bacterium]
MNGSDGSVQIDRSRQIVIKAFLNASPETAVRKARRELYCASRLREALSGVTGLSCPEIVEIDLSPPPHVIMRLCPGIALSEFLGGVGAGDGRLDRIAERIHQGLRIYVEALSEAHYDLNFKNLLYDEATEVLSLVDFAREGPAEVNWEFPLEASLGRLIGWTCNELVRPSRLSMRKAGYMALLRKVLARFGDRVSNERIWHAAYGTFVWLGRPGERSVRGLYYGGFGAAVVRTYLRQLELCPDSGKYSGSRLLAMK